MENERTPLTTQNEESGFMYFLRLVYRLRGVFLSIPVAIVAVFLAVYSVRILPAEVGILMQANGRYQFYISKALAIVIPLVLTALCVTLTICSKKVTFPWMISLFSLLLPLLLWLTTTLTT